MDRFITEIPLKVTSRQEKKLLSRLEAARQVYNACLGEALRRLERLRESEQYQSARAMPKGRDRTKTFRQAERAVGLTEFSMHAYSKQFNHAWMREHLDSQVNKRLAKRAYETVRRWQFGIGGRPKFRRYGEVNSVEGINNLQSIRWLDDRVVWASSTRDRLEMSGEIDLDNEVMMHGLQAELKYVRLVRRAIRGRNRFYAQLVCEGKPYQRIETGQGSVGLDVGPSTVAIVAENGEALLVQFCAELEERQQEIRRLQRKIDRQRRANNPENYNPDGTVKKGPKRWVKSNRQRRTEQRLSELQRKHAAHRRSLHGQLVNQIMQMGNNVKTEALSYRAFQRMFGRSVGFRAPGMFIERLRRRADALGAVVIEFPTASTRFSQLCHNCGSLTGKALGDRVHSCDCGIQAQRDLYSAFLAMCYDEETGQLNGELAGQAWQGTGAFQGRAFAVILDAAAEVHGETRPGSFGPKRKKASKRV